MKHKQQKYFGITLLLSFAVHLFVLTVLFTIPDKAEPEGYKKVRVKLGIQDKARAGNAASIQKYTSYNAGVSAAAQKEMAGNSTRTGQAAYLNKSPENKKDTTSINNNGDIEKSGKNIASLAHNAEKGDASSLGEQQEFERVLEQAAKNIDLPVPLQEYAPAAGKQADSADEEEGVVIGNSVNKDAGKITSYEQLLPLWLYKFKKYPAYAKENHITGTGEIFIKIDRKGRILLSRIIKSTGSKVLDNALTQMIADADPVIPVPDNYYSDKKTFSYKIAFAFEDK